MKNGYILTTEILLRLRSISGAILQIEGQAGHATPATGRVMAGALATVRENLHTLSDDLVEVQALFPEPDKAQIEAHYTGALGARASIMTLEESNLSDLDKRPAGWTEALALEFLSDGTDGPEEFAKSFLHGDWPTIQKEWPEFQTWINKMLEGGHARS